MNELRLLSVVAVSLLAACASPQSEDESPSSSESELASGYLEGMCGRPVPSDDGQFVFVDRCVDAYGFKEIVRISVVNGARKTAKLYRSGDRVVAMGSNAGLFFYVTEHSTGDWDVTVRDVALATPARTVKPLFPSDATAAQMQPPTALDEDIVLTSDAKHVVFTTGVYSRFLFIAEAASDAPAVRFDLGAGTSRALWPAPDGKRVLIVKHPTYAPRRTLRTLDLTTFPMIGPELSVELDSPIVYQKTYDGERVLVSAQAGDGQRTVLASINALSGARTVLASDIDLLKAPTLRGQHVWYTARRWDSSVTPPTASWVIERAPVDGSATPLLLANMGSRPVDGLLSRDGTAFMFRVGYQNQPQTVGVVPADGSSAPRTLADGVSFRFMAAAGGRRLVEARNFGTTQYTTSLIDDVTGAVVQSWPRTVYSAMLSSDGKAVYQTRTCALGSINGREVVRVTGSSEQSLLPCSLGGDLGTLVPIPNSSAVLYMRVRGEAGLEEETLRELTVLQP